MPKKKLVIKKEDLVQVRLNLNKYYNISGDEHVESCAWEEWKKSCLKAFPVDHYTEEWEKLKGIARELRNEPIETWFKVYQALGYKVE